MTSLLATSRRGPVTLLRLSRAAKPNALNLQMIAGIEMFFCRPTEGTRGIVLRGDDSHFCAGADLAAITECTASAGIHISRAWHRAFEQIEHGQVPVIAVLSGAVIGRGLELAAAAQIRVAEQGPTTPWRTWPRTRGSRTRASCPVTSSGSSASRRCSSGRPQEWPNKPQFSARYGKATPLPFPMSRVVGVVAPKARAE